MNKCFERHFFFLKTTTVQNYFEIHAEMYRLWPGQAQSMTIFYLHLFPVTLTFNLPKNVSNGTFPSQGQQLCKIVLKSMNYGSSYGPDKSGRMHGHTDALTYGRTHMHRTKIVTTMSRLHASRLDKNDVPRQRRCT